MLTLIWQANPPLVLASFGLRVLRSVLPLATLWVGKIILDSIVSIISGNPAARASIWRYVIIEILLAITSDLTSRLTSLCDGVLGEQLTNKTTVQVMRHAAQLDLACFEDPAFYDILDRARRQAATRLTVLTSSLSITQDLLCLISLAGGLMSFSPWLILVLVASVLPSLWGESWLSRRAYRFLCLWTPEQRQREYLRLLGSSRQAAKEAKVFGLGEHFASQYSALAAKYFRASRSLAIERGSLGFALNLVSSAGFYSAYVYIMQRALAGTISVGSFVFFTGVVARISAYVQRMCDGFSQLTEQSIFVTDLMEFLELKPTIRSLPGSPIAPRAIKSGIEFRNVSFSYPGTEHEVLHNLSCRLEAKQKIALIGMNGAGKSTIVKLLARLYDPTRGAIFLDGIDLREYDVTSLRDRISIVFQDYMRYEMSARSNIGLGKLEYMHDIARVQMAAKLSGASTLIATFANGYEQMLGRRFDGGVDLSGGEWQKLALARAYVRDTPIIVLDEPTASIDARAEVELVRDFAALTEQKLAIVISHRFSTARIADKILVLGEGRVVEQGCHEELLGIGGEYSKLFHLQASGYA